MNPAAFIISIQSHYLDQFRVFAEKQRQNCVQGSAEVKFQIGEDSGLFRGLYCVDFVKNDGQVEPVLEPGTYLVERRRRECVMDHGIIPLQLLYQEFGATKPTRYRLEGDEIRLKLRRFDLSVILDKVDATKPPKEPTVLTDLEFYFR